MIQRTIASSFALAGFVFLAFGSGGGSSSSDFDWDELENIDVDGGGGGASGNAAACKAYVEKINSLECFSSAPMDAGSTCPDSLDLSPVNMADYYNCLTENTKCDGAIPDVGGTMNCSMPTM